MGACYRCGKITRSLNTLVFSTKEQMVILKVKLLKVDKSNKVLFHWVVVHNTVINSMHFMKGKILKSLPICLWVSYGLLL